MISNNSVRSTTVFVPVQSKTAVHLVQSSRFAQRLAKLLLIGLLISVLAMAFLPWQQSSRGTGQVVAYVPQERQQTIEARVKGIVARVADGLVEGSAVKQGDFILEIQPVAANLAEQLRGQQRELEMKLASADAKIDIYQENVRGFSEAAGYAVDAANQMVESARDKLEAKGLSVAGYEARKHQAGLAFERQQLMFESGITAEREVEIRKREWDVATAELEAVRQDVEALENELEARQSELEERRRIAQTKVDTAKGLLQDAIGNAATIRKEIREIAVKLDELSGLVIEASRDGTIFRMPVYERGQLINEGEPIVTIVPEVTRKAVELWVPGNDMPLVQTGQEVRLQFEGWPAVQFPGWPSVAVGTFSGIVSSIDATDNGKGQFRILIVPNEADQNEWPSERFLRQGVRVNGWVMLRRVSLGYEIWRQLNGFPVIVADEAPRKESAEPPKMPK